jgi:hypothetical protein
MFQTWLSCQLSDITNVEGSFKMQKFSCNGTQKADIIMQSQSPGGTNEGWGLPVVTHSWPATAAQPKSLFTSVLIVEGRE